jgi:ABC-2 type transport system permease protein
VTGLIYTRFELLRAFRNRRFLFFSLGFPLVLFFAIAAPQAGDKDLSGTGISALAYYMTALASFGTMMSMISSGSRIAGERQAGWTRQLRVTPLPARAYLRAKVVTAYAMAISSLLLLYIAGFALGARLPAGSWLAMTGLILIALLPFAALGIGLGHLLNVDSIGPLTGGLVSLLAVVSGTWFPVTSGFLHDIGMFTPSYWLVQAGRISVHGAGWGARGWITIIVWTVVLGQFARVAYRRDTSRV